MEYQVTTNNDLLSTSSARGPSQEETQDILRVWLGVLASRLHVCVSVHCPHMSALQISEGPHITPDHPPEPASWEAEGGKEMEILWASPPSVSLPRLGWPPPPPALYELSPFVTAWTLGRGKGGNLRE